MFEHSLIDLESKQQPRRRRWISLPIAIALHVVGVTAFAFASYWTVGSMIEPNTNIVFFSEAPLPELFEKDDGARPTSPETNSEQKETTTVKPPRTVQPTDETVPNTIPKPPTEVNVDDILTDEDAGHFIEGSTLPTGHDTGRSNGGDDKRSSGGTDNGKESESEIAVEEGQPRHITVGMTKPELIHQVLPRYPEVLRHAAIQGTVILEAVIDEQGNVTDVRVLKGLPMGLDREAVTAVEQWKFKPALLANKPVKVYFTLTVRFDIRR